MAKSKFKLVVVGDNKFITGHASANIVTALKDAGKEGMTYDALCRRTKSQRATLYVLAGRLRANNIIKTDTNGDGEAVLRLSKMRSTKIESVSTIDA